MTRPYIEKLPVEIGSSISMLDRRLESGIPFQWHHHPEYELTLTLNSEGHRFIGDHVGEYGHGDLVMVGPNLPHTWHSSRKIDVERPHVAQVVWFRQHWIDTFLDSADEFEPVTRLFRQANTGLCFDAAVGPSIVDRYASLFKLAPGRRLTAILGLLQDLADLQNTTSLSTAAPRTTDSRSRIDRVLQFLHEQYRRPLRLREMADLAAISESGLHRMFAKHTGTTVSAYLVRLRIGDACARLSGTSSPISHIASEVGYSNFANFNRQFKGQRGMTPRQYRALFNR